jgi:hypothetical protein
LDREISFEEERKRLESIEREPDKCICSTQNRE